MPLQLLPMQPSDAQAWAELDYRTFKETIGRVLWTRDPSPQTFASMAQGRLDDLQLPDTVHHKIVDTDRDPERPIAFASWTLHRHERSPAELPASCSIPDLYPERNRPACVDFWTRLFEVKREVMGGRPHIYLDMLGTEPKHQRRGAGRLLLQWAAEEADRLGLEIFIEASPPGRVLYSKFGFEGVRETLFRGAPFGVDVDELTTFMIRKPRTRPVD